MLVAAGLLVATLDAQTSTRVDPSVGHLSTALGVECSYCHINGQWKNQTNPKWSIAKNMMRMVEQLNSTTLANSSGVSCATCHAGATKPSRLPRELWEPIAAQWPASAGTDEGVKVTMSVFSASLGVACVHCHDEADWKSGSKPAYATAQRMNAMFEVFPKYMPPTARTQCYMCHKGRRQPARPTN